jgi:hypothetical protein
MGDDHYAPAFLGTLKGLSAYTREFERLGECLVDATEASFGAAFDRKLSVRRSPGRCIIQVGPCAMTVAWIRNRHDTADGELLIILWRGTVAPRIQQQFERVRPLRLTATAVGESVFEAEATCESDWLWRSHDEPAQRYSSLSLADLIVARLHIVYDAIDSRITA